MKAFLLCFTIAFMLSSPGRLFSQASADSSTVAPTPAKEKKTSIFAGRPGKSMLLSLVIPGAGQIYNKSYLRVPFVWGAVGGMGALMVHNIKQYECYKDAYIHLIDGTPLNLPKHCQHDSNNNGIWDLEEIDETRMRTLRDDANKNRQLAIVGFVAVWLLQSVDAYVDAHLKEFDINEDLSINFRTQFDNDPNASMRMGLFVQF